MCTYLVNTVPIDDESVGDYEIKSSLGRSVSSLTHSIAKRLAASEFTFVAVDSLCRQES
jgi:hypothetical protein